MVKELEANGLSDVPIDQHRYVMASLEATVDKPKTLPTVGLLAHVDTSPDVSGVGVKPHLVRNYQGGDITLPADPTKITTARENPWLTDCIGHDNITSDSTTLLGADDKVEVAEIMSAVAYWPRIHISTTDEYKWPLPQTKR